MYMKRLLFSTLLALMAIAGGAQTFTVDDLSYTVTDADAKTVSVKKTDATTGELVIPSSVTYEEETYAVTSIPQSAFASTGITSITIPASVLNVEGYAFQNCHALTAITIEDSETALGWNGSNDGLYHPLYAVTASYTLYLGRNLKTKGNRCYFVGATSVVIGDEVTTINASLFDGASMLASVTMGDGVTSIGAYAFQNTGTDNSVESQTISLSANVETIGSNAFKNCSKLTSINLGSKLNAIPEYMLANCTALTSITIPASVQSVGGYAFQNCHALTAITIEDSETALGWNGNNDGIYHPLYAATANYTLYLGRDLTTKGNRCYFGGATSVEIGPKVTAIKPNLFDGAPKLASVTMGNGVTTIGAYAFRNTGTDDTVESQTITLGANVETIGNNAFQGCSKLTSIDLGSKLTAIPGYMMSNCTALTSITIPASVQSVNGYAFENCHALTAITIEDSETALGWNGSNDGLYHPLYAATANYTLYLGRDLTTNGNRCYFGGATSVVIGDEVTTIKAKLFLDASKLHTVTMGSGVTTIGSEAFRNTGTDDSVESQTISLGANVETIGSNVFQGCSKLTSINLGSKLSAIPASMLSGCTALTSITIPASVQSVGAYAFQNCHALTAITIQDSETALAWNGDNNGTYDPLYATDAYYTLYLGRDLTTKGNRCYFGGATSVEIGDKVTTINNQLFDGAYKLASVTMGSGVTTIGAYAFRNTGTDDSVESQTISLGANVETIGSNAFQGCTKLTTIDLGTKLTSISENMLASCIALTGITIPASVQSVNAYAFYDCDKLTAITIQDSETALAWNGDNNGTYDPLYATDAYYTLYLGRDLTTKGNRCYFGGATSVEIGDKVTTINNQLFMNASKLRTVTMGSGVTTIGSEAFRNTGTDDSVESQTITLGANVETIGNTAFYGCSHLMTIDLGTKLTSISEYMLGSCTALTGITIPASVQSVNAYAFYDCDKLTSITIQDSETALSWIGGNNGTYDPLYAADANYTLYLGRDLTTNATRCFFGGATSVEIGDKVTTINNQLFDGAYKLASVTMGSGVTTIGAYAFRNTGTDVTVESQTITLGANVETIGNYAFSGCSKLTSINLGTSLTAIPENMLFGCSALTSITIPVSVQSVGAHAFYDCDGLTAITIEDSGTALQWNGTNYHPLNEVNSNYTLYLGRDLTTEGNQCFFPGASSVEFGPQVTAINPNLFNGSSSLTSVDMTKATNLTTIGAAAFKYSGLTSVSIPATIQTIGNEAFNFINALESVRIEDGDTPLTLENSYYGAFQNGDADGYHFTKTIYLGRNILTSVENRSRTEFDTVEELTIGPKVTTLRDNAFNGCYGLQSVDLSNATSLTSIGDNAFYNCQNLTSIDLSQLELTTISDNTFYGCSSLVSFTIPSTVTRIGAAAFKYSGLTSISIPATVQTIGNEAFNFINSLASVRIEDGDTPLTLENNYYGAFQNGDADSYHFTKTIYLGRNIVTSVENRSRTEFDTVEELTIGPKVTVLGDYAFNGCYGLQSVDLSNATGLTTIGDNAFYSCNNENLTRIDLSNTKVTSYGNYAFYNCSNVTEVVPPATLQTIGDKAFYYCSKLDKVTIPASVTTIGTEVFYYTDKMTSFTIEDSETTLQCGTIGDGFAGEDFYLGRNVEYTSTASGQVIFTNVKNVTIGPNVTTIKPYMFARPQVVSVNAYATTPLAINDYDFDSNSYANATLWVPGGTLAAYQAADGWKNFQHIDCSSFVVSITGSAHGTLAVADITSTNGTEANTLIDRETDVTFTATPDEGYELKTFTVNGEAQTPTEGQFTVSNLLADQTVVATFTPIDYTLTYTLDGGEATNPATYNIETATFTLTNPTREGYDFTGWKLNGEGETMMTVTIAQGSTGHLAYTATWTPTIYNIVYTMDGGTASPANPTTYTIETETFILTNPTKTGYDFTGWKLNGEGDAMMEVTITKGSTGDKAYTATWQINQYTITFDSNGGSDVDAITQDYDSSITAPEEPTREGYTFSGWLPAVPATMPAENMTCVAQWTINQYTITFDTNGGSVVDAITQDYSSTITAPADPTREGYEFAGWDKTIPTTMPAENVTITATWTPITYTIVYYLNGGTVAEGANPEEFTIETESFTLVNPTREYYDFKGWTGTKLNGPTMTVTIAKGSVDDREYTATWEKCTYNVSITGAGVTASNYQPKYGDNVTISIEPDEDRTLTSLTVNGVDVTAQVANNQYTIENVSGNVTVVATFASTKEFITLRSSVATFSCSQDLDFSTSDLKAYIAAGYNKATNTTLLVRVYDVPAGTGLLLKGNEGATYKIPYVTSSSYYVNLLKANLEARNIPQTEGEMSNFMLNKNDEGVYGFYRPSATSTLGAQKAYLQVPTSFAPSEANARVNIVFEDEDTVTNIEDYELFEQPGAKGLYNLQGLRVKTAGKGIYIENGKKVVKK